MKCCFSPCLCIYSTDSLCLNSAEVIGNGSVTFQALRVSMEEQRARQERDAREAVTASVAESAALSTGLKCTR